MGLEDKRFNGYLKIALPHALDAQVHRYIRSYLSGSAEHRAWMLNRLRPRAGSVLCVYGQRMAAMAVREESRDALNKGLVAVAIGAGRSEYEHDELYPLVALHHSAILLEVSLQRALEQIAYLLPSQGTQQIQCFLDRSDEDKSLEGMRLATEGQGDSFRYVSG
ncbi:hypothetical protein [Streptomyces mesophilus]|uniref:hypothetical protein n=1 Tax=Streptomyces mesophilus TaxID=1775132 RepID=UPI00331E6568